MIIAGHISCPDITGDPRSAISSDVLILQGEMGFEGAVVTDALNMEAVADNYTADHAALEAIKAGCDMLLMPEDFQIAYQEILEAVYSGELAEDRIDESVYRLWKLKAKWM